MRGSNGDGPLRGVYRLRPAAQSEGVNAAADGTPGLWRLLGLFLIVHI